MKKFWMSVGLVHNETLPLNSGLYLWEIKIEE